MATLFLIDETLHRDSSSQEQGKTHKWDTKSSLFTDLDDMKDWIARTLGAKEDTNIMAPQKHPERLLLSYQLGDVVDDRYAKREDHELRVTLSDMRVAKVDPETALSTYKDWTDEMPFRLVARDEQRSTGFFDAVKTDTSMMFLAQDCVVTPEHRRGMVGSNTVITDRHTTASNDALEQYLERESPVFASDLEIHAGLAEDAILADPITTSFYDLAFGKDQWKVLPGNYLLTGNEPKETSSPDVYNHTYRYNIPYVHASASKVGVFCYQRATTADETKTASRKNDPVDRTHIDVATIETDKHFERVVVVYDATRYILVAKAGTIVEQRHEVAQACDIVLRPYQSRPGSGVDSCYPYPTSCTASKKRGGLSRVIKNYNPFSSQKLTPLETDLIGGLFYSSGRYDIDGADGTVIELDTKHLLPPLQPGETRDTSTRAGTLVDAALVTVTVTNKKKTKTVILEVPAVPIPDAQLVTEVHAARVAQMASGTDQVLTALDGNRQNLIEREGPLQETLAKVGRDHYNTVAFFNLDARYNAALGTVFSDEDPKHMLAWRRGYLSDFDMGFATASVVVKTEPTKKKKKKKKTTKKKGKETVAEVVAAALEQGTPPPGAKPLAPTTPAAAVVAAANKSGKKLVKEIPQVTSNKPKYGACNITLPRSNLVRYDASPLTWGEVPIVFSKQALKKYTKKLNSRGKPRKRKVKAEQVVDLTKVGTNTVVVSGPVAVQHTNPYLPNYQKGNSWQSVAAPAAPLAYPGMRNPNPYLPNYNSPPRLSVAAQASPAAPPAMRQPNPYVTQFQSVPVAPSPGAVPPKSNLSPMSFVSPSPLPFGGSPFPLSGASPGGYPSLFGTSPAPGAGY